MQQIQAKQYLILLPIICDDKLLNRFKNTDAFEEDYCKFTQYDKEITTMIWNNRLQGRYHDGNNYLAISGGTLSQIIDTINDVFCDGHMMNGIYKWDDWIVIDIA